VLTAFLNETWTNLNYSFFLTELLHGDNGRWCLVQSIQRRCHHEVVLLYNLLFHVLFYNLFISTLFQLLYVESVRCYLSCLYTFFSLRIVLFRLKLNDLSNCFCYHFPVHLFLYPSEDAWLLYYLLHWKNILHSRIIWA